MGMELGALRQRCYVDDVTGCWNWRGVGQRAYPVVWVANGAGGGKTMSARIAAWLAAGHAPAPQGKRYVPMCRNVACINPKHTATRTWGEFMAEQAARGTCGTVDNHRARASNARRRRKVSDAAAHVLATSREPIKVLAERFGVYPSTVSKYRAGVLRRREVMPQASAFAWGGPR